jgi:glycosyltransferase involved in cell wall biosynthesis
MRNRRYENSYEIELRIFEEIRMTNDSLDPVKIDDKGMLPLVSIIIRTIGRPAVLTEALNSIRAQKYHNIEIIVIEDGQAVSSQMIKQNYPELQILYNATEARVGRCKAGNLGLALTKGKYINFLDDDDVLLPDHIEILVEILEANPSYSAAYAQAYEVPTLVISTNPFKYKEKSYKVHPFQPFNRLLLMYINYIPIQTILFKREIFEKCGGFDENLEHLEDWDLWMRYSLDDDFLAIEKITSKYRMPWKRLDSKSRSEKFKIAEKQIREKQKHLKLSFLVSESVNDIDNIINYYLLNNFYNAKKIMLGNILRILKIKNIRKPKE